MKFSQDFEKRNSATAQIWAVAGPAGFEIGPQRRDQFWKAGSDPKQSFSYFFSVVISLKAIGHAKIAVRPVIGTSDRFD
jgi:hypothetical protein